VADDGANGDLYGYRVAISGDGTKVVVGSHAEEASTGSGHRGAAYIYTLSDGSWSQTAKLLASDQSGTNASFGVSQAMNSDGTKVIIGAQAQGGWGAAYIYTYSSGSWSQEGSTLLASDKQADDQFGQSVSMNSDGTRVIVGAFWEAEGGSTAGAAYVFAYNGTSWAQEDKLVASDAQSGDWFGEAVSMSSDGTRVVVGARLEASSKGAAYVFNFSSGSWDTGTKIPVPSDIVAGDYLGQTVSISGDGTKVLIGAPADHSSSADSGSVYVFTYNGSSWVQEVKLTAATPGANAQFGMGSVSMNSDGTKIIVGEYQDYGSRGAAHIFTYSSGSWDSGLKIVPTSRTSSGVFGAGAAMSSDGTRVIVGEHENAVGKGAAYIFDYQANQVYDSATQVFTATGTGIVSGSTVQLEGADGSLYSVVDATPPNAAGTQVTFKMGSEAVEFPPSAMSTNTSITGYTASASYNSSTAWKAFDDTTNYWNTTTGSATTGYFQNALPLLAGINSAATQDISGTTHRGHWLQLQIPNPVVLSRAVIGAGGTGAAYQIGQFVILGSNDNINWTALHAGDNTSAASTSAPYSLSLNVTTLSAGSTEAFSYFRVVIKSKGTPYNFDIQLQNIQFFGGSGSWVLANQPYKVRINSTSGLTGTSTAAIGFAVGWTTAAGADLSFDINSSTTRTLVGTDGGGGTNRTFSISPLSAVQALPAKVGGGTLVLTGSTGDIIGQIAADQENVTTTVTFRLTDNGSGQFTDRDIDIKGVSALYSFSSFTFTNAFIDVYQPGSYGHTGPTLSQLTAAYSPTWTGYTSNLNVTSTGIQEWTVPITGSYQIAAYGAGVRDMNDGGYGARITGTCTLIKNEIIRILVGQTPNTVSYSSWHGAAGGTFVVRTPYNTDASIIVIAGGGAGGHNGANSSHGNASLTTTGQTGDDNIVGGQNGLGGSSGYAGNGGAGFHGNAVMNGNAISASYAYGAKAFVNGGQGGGHDAVGNTHQGGFGGGGRHGSSHGGGGGGYSGGGGSIGAPHLGGGGGSYKASFFTVTSEDNTVHDGPGSVTITKL